MECPVETLQISMPTLNDLIFIPGLGHRHEYVSKFPGESQGAGNNTNSGSLTIACKNHPGNYKDANSWLYPKRKYFGSKPCDFDERCIN